MTIELFNDFWEEKYPESYPIGYELKWIYQDRWFRIHSLPNSKRYAENDVECETLLRRQNELINDLIGEGEEIFLCYGSYSGDIYNVDYSQYGNFRKVNTLNLHEIRPEEFDLEDNMFYDIFVGKDKWTSNGFDKILKGIANEDCVMMFICPNKKCIVNPYDGGVDIILEHKSLKEQYKSKYKNWLSDREDGL